MPYPSPQTPIGQPFIELQTVDSTNNYALSQIHAGLAQHGTAVFAHQQLSGKGQRGRKWEGQKDANIALSIVIRPLPFELEQQFRLSALIAVAVHKFFAKYAGEESTIKWPNDIYWKDRKAGGILIENIIRNIPGQPAWQWAVIGVGININQVNFSPDLPNPVSLKQITGKSSDPVLMAKELCAVINEHYNEFNREGYDRVLSAYHDHFYKINQEIKLKKDNRVFNGRVKGISGDGKLIIHHATEEQFELGSIQWIIT